MTLVGSGKPIPTPTMPSVEGPSESDRNSPDAESNCASIASLSASRSFDTPASAKTACCSASWLSASRPAESESGFSGAPDEDLPLADPPSSSSPGLSTRGVLLFFPDMTVSSNYMSKR
ncbi:hypothetical protein D3C72_2003220 [compost metagenome]